MIVAGRMKEMVLRRASTGEIRRVGEEEEGMIRPRDDGLLKVAAHEDCRGGLEERGVVWPELLLRSLCCQ